MSDTGHRELKKDLAIGGAAVAGLALANHGAYKIFNRYTPGMMGGKGWFLGPATGIKRTLSTSANMLSGGKFGKTFQQNVLGTDKIFQLTLSPVEIRQRSEQIAKRIIPNFDSLSPLDRYEKSKKYEVFATKQMLTEQENIARAQGAEYIVGQSHFTPALASKFGFQEAPEVTRKGNELIWPHSYYKSERANSLKKIENGTPLQDLNEMDAYWLTANPKTVRLFKKSLKDAPADVLNAAEQQYKNLDPEYNHYLNQEEIAFKSRYDKLIHDIMEKRSQ